MELIWTGIKKTNQKFTYPDEQKNNKAKNAFADINVVDLNIDCAVFLKLS